METIQELINKLNWFDFLRKIKEILTGLNADKVYPVYSNNAAAIAGGLTVGQAYSTSAGDLKIVVA